MWCLRITGLVTGCLLLASAVAGAQDTAQADAQPSQPGATIVHERTESGVMPWRRTETRTPVGTGSIIVEIVETPGVERGWQQIQQTTSQTIHPTSSVTRVTTDRFGIDLQHQPVLLQRTESEQTRTPDNASQTVTSSSFTDVNGRLGLVSRQVEQNRSAVGTSQTDTQLLQRNIDGVLADAVRTTETERPITAADTRHDSSVLYRDINGQWRPIQSHRVEIHRGNASEQVDEETISRRDMNDTLGMVEKNVTRRSVNNGREDLVIERYVPRDPDAIHRSESRLDLNERVRVTTTVASDGTRETVEEVETRSLVSASDPVQVRRRVVTTVSPMGESVRQVFDLDVNGRLVLTATERETSSER